MDEKKIKHCEKCNKTFTSNAHYLIHCETELHKTGKRKPRSDKKIPDRCPHCFYTTKINTDMQTHIIAKHMTPEEQKKKFTYYCDHCKFGVLYKSQYDNHLNSIKHKKQLIYLGIKDN